MLFVVDCVRASGLSELANRILIVFVVIQLSICSVALVYIAALALIIDQNHDELKPNNFRAGFTRVECNFGRTRERYEK